MRLDLLPQKSTVVDSDLIMITDSEDGSDTKNIKASALKDYSSSGGTRVIVNEASDLSGELRSDVVYIINGVIDMEDQQITVPAGGLFIDGHGNYVSKLESSEASFDLFTGTGSLFLSNTSVEVSGASSSVFDLDNSLDGTGSVELKNVFFLSCRSLGDLNGYTQALLDHIRIINCANGITFSGTWPSGVFIDTALVLSTSGTVFSEGTALVIGKRFFSNANITIGDGDIAYSFSESNFTLDGGFQLIGGTISGTGAYVDGMLESSKKAKWRDTVGLIPNYALSQWTVSTEEVTVVEETEVFVLAEMIGTSNKKIWFTGGTANDAEYDSSQPGRFLASFTGGILSGNNNQIGLKLMKWDASGSTYVDLDSTAITANASGRIEHISIMSIVDLDDGDRVEVWVSNNTSTSNITVAAGSTLIITQQ